MSGWWSVVPVGVGGVRGGVVPSVVGHFGGSGGRQRPPVLEREGPQAVAVIAEGSGTLVGSGPSLSRLAPTFFNVGSSMLCGATPARQLQGKREPLPWCIHHCTKWIHMHSMLSGQATFAVNRHVCTEAMHHVSANCSPDKGEDAHFAS